MSANFRYPNISAATEKEQLAQIKSYLFQLTDQLNYVFSVGAELTENEKNQVANIVRSELKSISKGEATNG